MVLCLDAEEIGVDRKLGSRLTMMHGFTQNRRCWGAFADELAHEFSLQLVDAPGHGASAHVAADLPTGAALWGQTAGRATYLGYSMGGRHALQLAVDRPDLVERLVLIGTSAGIERPEEREQRLERDRALADRLEQIGIERFLSEWLRQPLFSTLPPAAAHIEERRGNTVEGLATSLRRAGAGAQEPLWDRLSSLDMPVLAIVGSEDERYEAIAVRMSETIGDNATHLTIAGAGHAVHLERPSAAGQAVSKWLS